jgi:hypothetical protein
LFHHHLSPFKSLHWARIILIPQASGSAIWHLAAMMQDIGSGKPVTASAQADGASGSSVAVAL